MSVTGDAFTFNCIFCFAMLLFKIGIIKLNLADIKEYDLVLSALCCYCYSVVLEFSLYCTQDDVFLIYPK